jgi:hypothetical protein
MEKATARETAGCDRNIVEVIRQCFRDAGGDFQEAEDLFIDFLKGSAECCLTFVLQQEEPVRLIVSDLLRQEALAAGTLFVHPPPQ